MKGLEIISWTAGVALLLFFFGAQAWGEMERQRDIAAYTQAYSLNAPALALIPERIEKTTDEEVLAILRISGIDMELPVRYGTDEQVLRRGPGLIEGTAFPGSTGNVAIAAHRDRHFRSLKELRIGELIELETGQKTHRYVITDLSIVEPDAVHVLDEIGRPAVTLVTCYPFYFVGNAPNRFIVRAESIETSKTTP